jgi:hypothetical protein
MEARGDRLVVESSFAAVRELLWTWRQVELAGVHALEGAARPNRLSGRRFLMAQTITVDGGWPSLARVRHREAGGVCGFRRAY